MGKLGDAVPAAALRAPRAAARAARPRRAADRLARVAALDDDDARAVGDDDEVDLDERRQRVRRVPPEREVLAVADLLYGRPARLAVAQGQLAGGAGRELERAVLGEPALEIGDRLPGGLAVDGEGDFAGDVH